MRPSVRLAAFAVVLAAAFGAGAAVGAVAGPIDVDGDEPTEVHDEGTPPTTPTTVVHPSDHQGSG